MAPTSLNKKNKTKMKRGYETSYVNKRARKMNPYEREYTVSYNQPYPTRNTTKPHPSLLGKYKKPAAAPGYRRSEKKTFTIGTAAIKEMQAATDAAVAVVGDGFLTNDAGAHCINQVPQGNSAATRIGKKITMRNLYLRARAYANTACAQAVSVVLVYDRNPNAATTMPAFTSIFQFQHSLSQSNVDNAARFKIVRRWNFDIVSTAAAGSTSDSPLQIFAIDELVKLKGLETHWTSANTDGSLQAMEQGALHLYCLGETNVAAADVYVEYTSRLYYSDQ